jgi:outer membrane biosynthesis protein TonB
MRSKSKILHFLLEHGSLPIVLSVVFVALLWIIAKQINKTKLSDKKKSIIISTYSFTALLIVLFFIRFWPPSDKELLAIAGGGGGGGVTVNFGDTDFGSGKNFDSKELDVKNVTKTSPAQPTPEESIISEDSDADNTDVVISKREPIKNPKPIVKTQITKPVEVKKPVVRKVDDALANILKGTKKGGDGNSGTSGNQGRANGDINSTGYSGSGGSGGGTGGGNGTGNGTGTGSGSGSGSGGGNGSGNGKGNGSGYDLNGRKALSKPQPAYNCNEEGIVVVQITVDKNGNVTDAKPGARGTTNPANCLASQAKIAAMNTKWNASPDGTEKQVGTIKYNFSLKD